MALASSNAKDVDVEMNKIIGPKDHMMIALKPFDRMNEQIAFAPLAICIIGQMGLIATQEDFSLRCDLNDKFVLLRFPSSFRACLSQVARTGRNAFRIAYEKMDAINKSSARVPDLLKTVLKLLYGKEKSEAVLKQHLPISLEAIKDVADQCQQDAQEVLTEFKNVTNLLAELQQATLVKHGRTKEAKELSEARIAAEKQKRIHIEKLKKKTESDLGRIMKEYKERKTEFDFCMKQYPGTAGIIAVSLLEGVTNAFSSTMAGITKTTLNVLGSIWGKKGATEESRSEDQPTLDNMNQIANQFYLLNLPSVESFLKEVAKMIQPNKNSKVAVNENKRKQLSTLLQDIIPTFQGKQGLKNTNIRISNILEKTIEKLKALEKTELENKEKTMSQFLTELNSSISDIENIHLNLKKNSDISQFTKKGPGMNVVGKNTSSVAGKMIEIANIKLEVARKQLENALEAEEKAKERHLQAVEATNKSIAEMQKHVSAKNYQERALNVLLEGMKAFAQLEEQWEQLVQFFSNIANVIRVSMSPELNLFVKHASATGELSFIDRLCGKEIVYQTVFQSSKMAHLVHHLSDVYCNVATKHLLSLQNDLSTILSLDSTRDALQIEEYNKNLAIKCEDVNKEIKKSITEEHENFRKMIENNTNAMKAKMEEIAPILSNNEKELLESRVAAVEEVDRCIMEDEFNYDEYA